MPPNYGTKAVLLMNHSQAVREQDLVFSAPHASAHRGTWWLDYDFHVQRRHSAAGEKAQQFFTVLLWRRDCAQRLGQPVLQTLPNSKCAFHLLANARGRMLVQAALNLSSLL